MDLLVIQSEGGGARNGRAHALLRRSALLGIATAAATAALVATALLVLSGQGATSTQLLHDLGHTARFAALVLLPLVVIAQVGERVTALSLALFTASMFLPVLQRHASGLAPIEILSWANAAVVAVLAIKVVRTVLDSARRSDDVAVC
ncbi:MULTISPECIES: hypothetical protein [unclassified Rhodococcus (in: high G+C Gram-positive bacteria)]|uniref:hypothetical protein n=1 Tax=Rhodococcus sp. SJ-3 TaxID=3454628 RepID=UPI003F78DE33